jgi:hypothetical protein
MPPLDAIQKHLGADAAIWNRIKADGVLESNAAETKAASEQSSVPAVTVVPDNLGFVASQAGVRVLAASQLTPAAEKMPRRERKMRAFLVCLWPLYGK